MMKVNRLSQIMCSICLRQKIGKMLMYVNSFCTGLSFVIYRNLRIFHWGDSVSN